MAEPEDDDEEAVKALRKVRDDLDGLRTRLKQVPHPSGGGKPADEPQKPRPATTDQDGSEP